ncbi:MAG TPA: sodium:proton antiporter [Phycisphaerae bacterium]|nr:sodium:proton antiporter [Phycisphaerae bacterium]
MSELLALVWVVVLGVTASWLAWRVRLPSILLLLLAGLVAGPLTGLIVPDRLLGDLLMPFVSLAVGLILYEGGLTLRVSELRSVGHVVRNLVTIGALVTLAISTVAARLIFDLPWSLALLLGAILIVTGPTVVGPLLRHIRPGGSIGSILKWEAIVIDPLGALLAVLIFESAFLVGADGAVAAVLWGILKTVVIGGGLGAISAIVLAQLMARFWVPDYLQNAVSLMLVVATQAVADHFQQESGLLAVTVMGMVLANQRWADVRHIVEFKENLQVLLISFLFVLLGARLDATGLHGKLWGGLAFVGVLVLVARPLAVWISTRKAKLSRGERVFLGTVAPRGIVAAAVSAVFALHLEAADVPGAEDLVPLTFMVIIGTVALSGFFSPFLAHRLGVAAVNPQGVLFGGAGAWPRALAKVLQDRGIRVQLVDTNHDNLREARMAGLPVVERSILSDSLFDAIDFGGLGRFFAVTPNDWINTLAVHRFFGVFGRRGCYQCATADGSPAKAEQHRHLHGRRLFGAELTYGALAKRFGGGFTIKATPLTEEFGPDAFRAQYGADALVLMAITDAGRLRVGTVEEPIQPRAGQTIISFVPVAESATQPAQPA